MSKKTFDTILFLAMIGVICGVGFCRESFESKALGGKHKVPQNGGEVESMGRFAIQQHNEQQNTLLKFVRVVKAEEQVVAGTRYYLTLEATDGSKKNLYEAKVWVKPWMNFKQLQEFSLIKN